MLETLELTKPKTGHALLSPSAAKRWMTCHGSVLLSKDIPSTTSVYAEEGTLAHDHIKKILTAHFEKGEKHTKPLFKEIEDEEMATYIEEYYQFIKTVSAKFIRPGDKAEILIEETVHLTNNTWGTLDFGIMTKRAEGGYRDLLICDFKYGKGVKVDIVGDYQQLLYALMNDRQHEFTLRNVYLYIYQPRIGGKPFSRWQPTREELKSFYSKVMLAERNILKILDGEVKPTFVSGDHCRFCPAAGKCPELNKAVKAERQLDIALLETNATPVKRGKKEVDNYTKLIPSVPLENLVELYEKKKLIEHYLDSVERYLMVQLEQGKKVPGYKLVKSRSRRKWKTDVDTVGNKLLELGVSHPWKKSLITIGDVEREIGKDKISDLTDETESKLQLAKEDDDRPGIDFTGALDMIDAIPQKSE